MMSQPTPRKLIEDFRRPLISRAAVVVFFLIHVLLLPYNRIFAEGSTGNIITIGTLLVSVVVFIWLQAHYLADSSSAAIDLGHTIERKYLRVFKPSEMRLNSTPYNAGGPRVVKAIYPVFAVGETYSAVTRLKGAQVRFFANDDVADVGLVSSRVVITLKSGGTINCSPPEWAIPDMINSFSNFVSKQQVFESQPADTIETSSSQSEPPMNDDLFD